MGITIMDGGMGGEIRARLPEPVGPLWATRALIEAPDMVRGLHKEYIDAGARLIITCNYSAIPSYLAKENLEHRYEELTVLAGQIAREAADESEHDVIVAGSIPPLDESYRPDLVWDDADAIPVYETITRALAPYVDLYICETMSTSAEARLAASQAIRCGDGKPVYVSWTLDDETGMGLRSGESITEAYEALRDTNIDAFLFNCTYPESVEAALDELAPLTDRPIGGYANRMTAVKKDWALSPDVQTPHRQMVDEAYFADWGERCIGKGASIVGGCCGIGPSHISALASRLNQT